MTADHPDNATAFAILPLLRHSTAAALMAARQLQPLTIWSGYRPQLDEAARSLRLAADALASAPQAPTPVAGQGEPVAWAFELADAFERSGKTLFFPEQYPVGYPAGWDAAHRECAKDLRHAAKYPPVAAPAPSRPADRDLIERVIRDTDYNTPPPGGLTPQAWLAQRILLALREAPPSPNAGDGAQPSVEPKGLQINPAPPAAGG